MAEIMTAAVTHGSARVVASFRDLAFEFISIAHITWQGVGE